MSKKYTGENIESGGSSRYDLKILAYNKYAREHPGANWGDWLQSKEREIALENIRAMKNN